jgi:serine/threonine protein kinase
VQPPTIDTDALLDLLTRHQVIEAEPLWQFVAARGGAAGLNPDASEVAADLIRDGLLTEFQAEHLLAEDADPLLLGKYLLLDRIGGLGSSVYLARLRRASANTLGPARPAGHFAIKILGHDQDIPRSVVERFRREAQALARLDHSGIVSIKDSGEDQGRLFLVMEHIDGRSLDEVVQRQGPLLPAMAVRIIHAALDAVAHIHAAGLIHRNLEPGHIMLDQAGNARIVDLGMARFLDDPGADLTMLNGHSQFLGTVEYQSPEQLVNSHDVDIRTDIYALGAILYFLLTGKPPFSTHALLRLAAGVVTHPQPLAQLRPDLPRDLVAAVETMMACDRNLRYPTPRAASAALDAWLIQVSPPPLKVPVRRKALSSQGLKPCAADERADPAPAAQELPPPPATPAGLPAWGAALLVFLATAAVALAVLALAKGP